MNNTQSKSEIRWMIRRDMDQVMDIEHAAFQWPDKWTENTFLAFLRQRNAIGTVITTGGCWDPIAGFMVYESTKSELNSLDLPFIQSISVRDTGLS